MNIDQYKDFMVSRTVETISLLFKETNIINRSYDRHTRKNDNNSPAFQKYYVEVTGNKDIFLTKPFFRKFKKQYSLLGVGGDYLDDLERNKPQIHKLANDDMGQLYDAYFLNPKVYGDVYRSQGSFFTKLMHTLKPNEYCVVDSYVRRTLHLEKESYYVSMLIISEAYKKFSAQNPIIMEELRRTYKEWDVFYEFELSDVKLLDLFLWAKGEMDRSI